VNEVVMIEIDEGLTNISRKYIPEWSDCSDILDDDGGRSSSDTATAKSDSCFDNPRATVHFQDAFAYFLDEFGEEYSDDDDDAEGYTEDDDDEELFDSIIMDALDPDDFGIFVDKLYNE
jgi:spermidine synthase